VGKGERGSLGFLFSLFIIQTWRTKKMDLKQFLVEHGTNIVSDYSWIFPDSIPKGNFCIIGTDVKKSSDGKKEIPCLVLQDIESKVKYLLSVWACNKAVLMNFDVEDIVKLTSEHGKIVLVKTGVI
jgi:hypothetical protein